MSNDNNILIPFKFIYLNLSEHLRSWNISVYVSVPGFISFDAGLASVVKKIVQARALLDIMVSYTS